MIAAALWALVIVEIVVHARKWYWERKLEQTRNDREILLLEARDVMVDWHFETVRSAIAAIQPKIDTPREADLINLLLDTIESSPLPEVTP